MYNRWQAPKAIAYINGGPLARGLRGTVTFENVPGGTLVCAYITGLPDYKPAQNGSPPIGPHGFHLHENSSCAIGDLENPFQAAGGHWNPTGSPHGDHAGDFPVLFSNNGEARMCFFTSHFKPIDILGKTVIIRQSPDDYRSQPAGNAGKRLACGLVRPMGY